MAATVHPQRPPAADDPLSPVVNMGRGDDASEDIASAAMSSSDIYASTSRLNPQRRPMSRDFSGSTDMSLSPLGEEPPAGDYGDEDIAQDGYRTGWLAHASTEHLNPRSTPDGEGPPDLARDPTKRYSRALREEGGGGGGGGGGHHHLGRIGSTKQREQSYHDGGEDSDAQQVQLNLERWAAAERQRRKAARTSRSSFLGPPGAPGATGLARRLTFGSSRKASPNTLPPTSPTSPSNSSSRNTVALLRKGSASNSISSIESGFSDTGRGSADSPLSRGSLSGSTRSPSRGAELSASLEDVPEDDVRTVSPTSEASSRDRKGKARATENGSARDSWSPLPAGAQRRASNQAYDPSPFAESDRAVPERRRSVKPTASRPIVTPGRAPSVRRTPAGTPSIVATDVDGAGSKRPVSAAANPFLSRSEAAAAAEMGGNYAMGGVGRGNPTIDEDDDQDFASADSKPQMARRGTSDSVASSSTVTVQASQKHANDSTSTFRSAGAGVEPSKRFSTSSKFREVGLDEDADGADGAGDSGITPEEAERRRQLRREAMGSSSDSGHDGARGGQQQQQQRGYRKMDDASSMSSSFNAHRRRDRAREAEEDREMIREGKGRQPWWTEWLCGCGRVVDEDNEQTGKTGPE